MSEDRPRRDDDTLAPYVMSRGRSSPADYAFLGIDPPSPWWRAYAQLTDDAFPVLLAETDADGWRLYLSGIPSARTDQVGTPIRFTLALYGDTADTGDAVPGREQAVELCRRWLAHYQDESALPELGARLDALFPDDAEVTALLTGRTPEQAALVRARLLRLLADLDPTDEADAAVPIRPDSWFGSVHTQARDQFTARLAALLNGEVQGRALLLNLVRTPANAPAPAPGESLAVLTTDPEPAVPIPLPVHRPGSEIPSPPLPRTLVLGRAARSATARLLAEALALTRLHHPRGPTPPDDPD